MKHKAKGAATETAPGPGGTAAASGAAAGVSGPQGGTDVEAVADEELTPEELAARWEEDAAPPAGPQANFWASLVTLAIGIAAMVLSVQLDLGTPAEPRPGMWPFLVSLVIAVLSVTQLVVGRRGGRDGEKFSKLSWLAAVGFATLLALVALMPLLGFEIPAVLLCFVWMKILGGESWRSSILYSLIIVAAFYAIFILGLQTTIPHLF
ncbi:tripartite tricarboxylate transporter TctB family protein [Micrococcaceae bacterium RIT802]|jgi:hypothetical protein|nr:tripartite tricarboxylate transporter TctB family protein [Micrococcaceae bacterium RIT 802]